MSIYAVGGMALVSVANTAIQSRAAKKAGQAQERAAQAGIDETGRQFDKVQELLAPFVSGGESAFNKMGVLAGIAGPVEQSAAVSELENSPMFQALARQGENAILQNASATGGLRGGNLQAALAQFRPQMLNQLIEQQYGRLNTLANYGQASAAGTGAAAQAAGAQNAALLGQIGQAQAGSALGRANAYSQGISGLGKAFGTYMGSTI